MSTLPDPKHDPSNASKIILLTGINGYIASHIALQLLQKGYTVRGTSRSPDTPARILSQPSFTQYASIKPPPLQHIVVPDITIPGAFDTAVRDCHAIIHTASPVDFTLKTVDEFMAPAIGGVLSIIQSVYNENAKHGGHIKSFVLTSSIAAIQDRWRFPPISAGGTENRAYTEADWNTSGAAVARQSEIEGPFLSPVAYGASKAAAEKTMWDFAAQYPQISDSLSLSAINPGVVTGPPIVWPSSPAKLNATLLPVWAIWSGDAKTNGNKLPPQIGAATYIDVRDVAALHVWCMEHPEESRGQRYLATNGKANPQACADVLRRLYPECSERIILGNPGEGYVVGTFGWPEDEPTAKATKAFKAMGVREFRSFEVSIKDTIDAFRQQWPELGL